MKIYTMGFTQKSAEEFFEKIKKNQIELLIDIRLNNQSQLAGFAKGKDLTYFLDKLCQCRYVHELSFAPDKDLLDDYKKGRADWDQYVVRFNELMYKRAMVKHFQNKYSKYDRVLLLCSEPTPEQCHRRLLAEAIAAETGDEIVHI